MKQPVDGWVAPEAAFGVSISFWGIVTLTSADLEWRRALAPSPASVHHQGAWEQRGRGRTSDTSVATHFCYVALGINGS